MVETNKDLEQTQLEKLREELLALRAERRPMVVWLRTISSLIGVLSLSVGFLAAAFGACSALQSIALAKESEKRLNEATQSEIATRAAATKLSQEAELRLKQATASEVDIRILVTFVNEVLPRLSGVQSSRLVDSCFEAALKAKLNSNEASSACTAHTTSPRAAQVAAYWAGVDLANNYPMLCQATRAALQNQARDSASLPPLQALKPCPGHVP